MQKYLHIGLKIIYSLIILIPIVSYAGILLGFDIEAKREYYNTDQAFAFIQTITDGGYIAPINALIFTIGLVLLWMRRTALAAVLMFPITVNIVAFHAFLDGGLLTGGALMGNILLAINLYFFWRHREQYAQLLAKE